MKQRSIIKRGVSLFVAAIMCAALLTACGAGGSGFSVPFSPSGVKNFLNKACKNTDTVYAKVIETEKTSSDYISAVVEVKLKDKAPQEVEVSFSNTDYYSVEDSDKVETLSVKLRGESETHYNCIRQVVLEIEKTLGGGRADELLLSYDMMRTDTKKNSVADGYWISQTARGRIAAVYNGETNTFKYYEYEVRRDRKLNADKMDTQLIGTWSGTIYDGSPFTMAYTGDGYGWVDYNSKNTNYSDFVYLYQVDDDNTIRRATEGTIGVWFYSEKAKDGGPMTWYLEGDTLYFGNYVLTRD